MGLHRSVFFLKKKISLPQKARRLGYAVYDYYRGSARAVPLAKLMAPVRKNGTAEHVVVALEVLQEGEAKTSFNEDAMLSIFTSVYQKRKNLSLSLLNLESITAALGDFLSGAVGVLTVILLNIVFSTGDLAEVAITVSSAILGLSFIFSTSAQQTFNSFIFLFVRHAYDIGDRVTVPGPEVMNVVKMEVSVVLKFQGLKFRGCLFSTCWRLMMLTLAFIFIFFFSKNPPQPATAHTFPPVGWSVPDFAQCCAAVFSDLQL